MIGPHGEVWRQARAGAVPSPSEAAAIDRAVEGFMAEHSVPGLSVAAARRGEVLYSKGYGVADRQTGERVTPDSLFRIASVSKPVTSVALFTLIERGRLRLEDVIFGPRGVLGTDYGRPPYPQHVEQIRLHHLMTHTCGGWPNDALDPMFHNPGMDHWQLISWTLVNRPLTHAPGERSAYSNFGYCVLGRVIEKVTGQRYDEYVRDAVLKPCGISDMRLAGNTLAARLVGEVVYHGAGSYGMNVARMDAHGGWLATAADLVRFVTRVDRVLGPASIRDMTTPTAANPRYAKGWNVDGASNWWHTGSLPGCASVLVRSASGLAWAALANAWESRGADTAVALDHALDQMMWKMVEQLNAGLK